MVLTVPDDIAAIAFQNKAVALLFRTAAETLRTIAADPQHLGAEIGFFAVWHTWGQTLAHHPHLHGVVPGGGLSRDGRRWVACRPGCFLPVRVRSRLFRRRLLEAWHAACEAGTWPCFGTLHALADRQACAQDLAPARQTEWVVYAKPPCAGPPQVLDDVGRDTHRVAIAHSRLLDREAGQGRFRYTDDRDDDHPQRTMTLAAAACIRRVLLHVLPARFPRLRHDGRLGNRHRKEHLARCRQRLGTTVPETLASASTAPRDDRDRYEALTGISLRTCPVCRDGHMRIVEHVARARWAAAITDTS